MPLPPPLNLPLWISQNGHRLQPPVNNFCLYRGKDYVIMVVGGPNERSDYHINETEVRHLNWTPLIKCTDTGIRNGFTSTKVGCSSGSWTKGPLRMCASRKAKCFYCQVRLAKLTVDAHLNADRIGMLVVNTPHNPVRFADTIGLVVERVRPEGSIGEYLHTVRSVHEYLIFSFQLLLPARRHSPVVLPCPHPCRPHDHPRAVVPPHGSG